MSMSLHFTNRAVDTAAIASADWAALIAIAAQSTTGCDRHAPEVYATDGMVVIDEDVVDSIARLLEKQTLANGETVSSYPRDEDDEFSMPSYVSGFGPALLPIQVQDYVRDRLARSANGKIACRLFDEILKRGLQVSFKGEETCKPCIKAVNWRGDDVTINLCTGTMHEMLRDLGLDAFVAKSDDIGMGECDFASFETGVSDFADYVGTGHGIHMPERLEAFVACAKRGSATHVYWA